MTCAHNPNGKTAWLLAVCALAAVPAMPAAAGQPAKPELVEVRKIWDQAPHNAFTDLVRHQGRWWCVFREGQGHVSPDGALRVLTSADGVAWESAARLASATEDLRDAKLTVTPSGDLMLGGAGAKRSPQRTTHQSYVWLSKDGRTWSDALPVADPDYWLWRVTWHKGVCWGIGYDCAVGKSIRLYRSEDGRRFETHVESLLAEGSPNETSIVFLPDDTALCLLRRDGKPSAGLLGTARPPYRDWTWKDTGRQIGGPHMLRLPDGRLLAAVRLYDGRVRTSLCWVDPASGRLDECLALPSGGDTSYAGLVWHENLLWVSYYSSHEGKTSIYLAKVRVPPATRECHVWEKTEIVLRAQTKYDNPYTDAVVWVDLEGPGFKKRCYGFGDGGDTFRVRVAATAPGKWTWRSGSRPVDPGLSGASGSFTAVAWGEREKQDNPCRRGTIRPSANGHAFQYADGTPFFLLGDTWWAASTFRFPWRDDDRPSPLGPQAGFKDYVRYRVGQEFNCIAIIAAFPNWANDGKPAGLNMAGGTVLRSAWRQAGTRSAKTMTDEAGRRPFLFPGKVPGYEAVFPDLERINPAYFHALDKKIDYLNAHGMVPFIEVARRDIGQGWKKYYPWPDSYTRYIQYVWSRYQANVCLLSPIHLDTPAESIPVEDWNLAANRVIETFGPPPFGTLAGTNSNPSSLRNWGHVDRARWLGFHQIGNRRTHDVYPFLTEIFHTSPPVPAINGEPYYDGMENLEGGTEASARYCRSAMYGSVLCGGLGGHIYGAGGWEGGLWSGEVEPESKYPIWQVITWPSAGQMRHLKRFVLSEGPKYQDLAPEVDLLSPSRAGTPKTCLGWAYSARAGNRGLFLLYFEKDCPQASLSGMVPGRQYAARWFNPRTGEWTDAKASFLTADSAGKALLPRFPGDKANSDDDWGLKLKLAGL